MIRQLINANELEQAETFLRQANQSVSAPVELAELGYFVALRHRANGDHERALRHLADYLDGISLKLVEKPETAGWMVKTLAELPFACERAGKSSSLASFLATFQDRADAAVMAWNSRPVASENDRNAQLAAVAALMCLRSEVGVAGGSLQTEHDMHDYFTYCLSGVSASEFQPVAVHAVHSMGYVEAHAYVIRDRDQWRRVFGRAREMSGRLNDTEKRLFDRTLRKTEVAVERAVACSALIGRVFPIEEVVWQRDIARDPGSPRKSLVCVFPPGESDFDEPHVMSKMRDAQVNLSCLQFVALRPYAADTAEAEASARQSDIAFMSKMLRRSTSEPYVGIAPEDFSLLANQRLSGPLFVVVGPTGTIRAASVSQSDPSIRHLRSELQRQE